MSFGGHGRINKTGTCASVVIARTHIHIRIIIYCFIARVVKHHATSRDRTGDQPATTCNRTSVAVAVAVIVLTAAGAAVSLLTYEILLLIYTKILNCAHLFSCCTPTVYYASALLKCTWVGTCSKLVVLILLKNF